MSSSSRRRPFSTRHQLLALTLIASIIYAIIPLPRFAQLPFIQTAHAAAFATGNVVVYRVGATGSSTALSSAATAVFLDEYTPTGTLVQSIALPSTATTSGNRALTAAGSSGSEGLLTRSTDGRYLILTGYNATIGTTTVASSAASTTNRVVGRVDSAGAIDTTTALTDAYSGSSSTAVNIRSATSTDGSSFYLGGSSGGVRYATLGATTSSSISTTQGNIRQVNIFNNQLYASSGSSPNVGVNKIGTGLSTASGQSITLIAPDGGTSPSPYGFFFANTTTLYVADDRANTSGGILKYTSADNGATFTLAYTINIPTATTAIVGARGLTGIVSGGNATLYATTTDNRLVTVTDTLATTTLPSPAPTFTTLGTAATNTAFRGVALAPIAATPVPGTLQFSSATYSVNENGGTATITVTRTGGSNGAVSITYATSNGTATAGSDYTATTGTLTFSDGDSASKTFTVPITDDTLLEGDETVNLTLSAPTGGATLGTQSTAVLTIIDNETPQPGTLQFSASTYSVAENGGTATITVTRTGGSDGSVSVNYATSDGTATSGSDYTATSGTLTFANGDSASKTFTVTIIDDSITESNETVNLTLSGATGGATLGTPNTAVLTIIDDDIAITPIYNIQGSGASSPFVGQSVTTTGIVTGRKSNGFFLQDPNGDGNDNTSDAVLVFTSTAPSSVAIGNSVRVTGTVSEFRSSSSDEPVGPDDPKTLTEITSPTIVVLSTGNALPAAKDSSLFTSNATSRGNELEKYESMLVSVSSLTVSEPTNNNFGEFWGVATGQARPFREPGIERGDPIPAADQGPYAGSPPPNPPIFDGNFERILVDSDDALTAAGVRRTAIFVSTGAVVTGIAGPLDYSNDNYRISLGGDSTPGITPGISAAVPVPTRAAGEFTIGHANLENFGTTNTNFSTRLNKASLAVRNVMRTPDILGLIEIVNFETMQQLAAKINADVNDPATVNYVPYMGVVSGTQNIGYLVNSARITVVGTPVQLNRDKTFTFCGTTSVLHDRPPYILTADVPQPGVSTPLRVTVILNHTKSLIATDSQKTYGNCGAGGEGARNREKRRLQAEDIADEIERRKDENLVVLGDFNAYQFNDGLIDVVGTIEGTPPPAEQVVEPSTDRWTYQLTDLIDKLPAAQKYSYSFEGNAQAIDHVLVNDKMLARNTNYGYGRYDADFDLSFAADSTRPERLSDHDAPVAYFAVSTPSADLQVTKTDSPDPVIVGSNITYTITVANNGTDAAQDVSLTDALPANTTFQSLTQTQGTAFACTSPAAGSTGTVTCTAASLASATNATFTLVVQVDANATAGSVITNSATATTSTADSNSNNNTGTATTTVNAAPDTTPPSVTINQASGQADPTNASPINFTVVFSESVTGFTNTDVSLAGSTANVSSATITVTGSGANYTVEVNGITSDGTVVASIPAGAATDAAGNQSTASTSTDNTVTYNAPISPAFTNGAPPNGTVGTAYTFTFTANGTPSPTFSVTTGTPPAGLTLASDGTLSGTSTTAGSFTFTVTASNGVAPNATQTVTIKITGTPTANNDTYTVNENSTLNVAAPGVLANDTDAAGNSLTAVKVSDPAHGSVTLNSNGSFTYTPVAGFSGADSFTYKANNGTFDSNTAIVNINVASGGTLQFSVAAYTARESDGTATITVTRTGGASGAATVRYATSDGTATAGSDYTATSGTISFADGEQGSKTFTVPIINDTVNEPSETLNLTLSNVTGSATPGSPSTATLMILDDDAAPTLAINDVSQTEGNTGTTAFTFTVMFSGSTTQTVTVNYATANGTATAGSDYTATNGTLTFAPGETSKQITVQVTGDSQNEPDETFLVNLTNAANATLARAQGTGTIRNDDTVLLQLDQAAYTLSENDGSTLITVTRTGDASQAASIDYATNDVTAKQKSDYTLALGTLQFAAGETTKTFRLFVNPDSYIEGAETLTITLSNPSNASLGAQTTAVVTIPDGTTDATRNSIDDARNFVLQQYHDFLNRDPDPGGFAYWTNEITKCGADQACINSRRVSVTAAFFIEREFQDTGFAAYRLYKATFGRAPNYLEYTKARSQFVAGQSLTMSKQYLAGELMKNADVKALYDNKTNAEYVDATFRNASVVPDSSTRAALIDSLQNGTETRADVLIKVADTQEFIDREYNAAFVTMEYFGYLRRDVDEGGYQFWLDILNNRLPNNFRGMVCAFVNSREYQERFSSVVTHTDKECAQQ